ncbi:MAG TPA: polysaccharide deacetylase family protein [Candidatus Dormibacteraeota bacterium]|nr:polysaccharide deacetylase family protein [Candidatus Dormibacteraeota bacterium]
MGGPTHVPWRIGRLVALAVLLLGSQSGAVRTVTAAGSPPGWLPEAGDQASGVSVWSRLAGELPLSQRGQKPVFSLRPMEHAGMLQWQPPRPPPLPDIELAEPAGIRAPVDSEVRLLFSEPMDTASVEESFRVEPSVSGQFNWPDQKTLVFHLFAPLAYRTTYWVSVAGYAAAQPRLIAAASFSFSTLWPPPAVPFPFTLTFDDCGSADQIQAILTALADRGLHAIFFPTGKCRDQFPWLIPTLIAAGHRVCNHTYSHPDLSKLSAAAIISEIQRGVSVQCDLFRPPYGAMDRFGRVYSAAASLGYRIQLWDVDTRDWAGTPADLMVAMIRAKGGVVLMHMHGIHTVEAIRAL